jgi:hypothetical protein
MLEGKGSRDKPMRLGAQHEEFLELCALATSGSLHRDEAKKLREHLVLCSECREAVRDFYAVVDGLIPELKGDIPLDPSFSQEKAEAAFEKRLAEERERERIGVEAGSSTPPLAAQRRRFFREYFYRSEVWLPLVASAVLCGTFGILSYRTGRNHGVESARLEERNKLVAEAVMARTPPPLKADDRDRELVKRDAALADLRREIAQKSSELEKLKVLASSQRLALQASSDDKNGVTEERDRLLEQVSADEETLRTTQERLRALERERSNYVIHTASLETSVTDLSRSLQDRERETAEQQDLLAKDRDIRDLIGARDQSMAPLLPPGTFLQIDPKQNRIKKGPYKKSSSESHFARPIYFLDIRGGYKCGWCELKNGVLTFIPHPDSGEQTQSFRYPDEVSVVGRVTAITMSIEEERFVVRLDEGGKGKGKK